MFFLFRRKERTKEKSDWLFSRVCILIQTFFMELYAGSYIAFLRRLTRPEPAAFFIAKVYGSRKL